MMQVNVHEAKTHLSALIEKAANGEPFVIAKSGKPMVKVIPFSSPNKNVQRVGFLKGQIKIPEDFDQMHSEEITASFDGRL